jgi:hypothetical protein
MISSFSQYLVEEERVVYSTFGRMNPPTIGHGTLLDALYKKAGRNPYKVFLSQSHDAKKNPLTYSEKVKHLRKMFPKYARSVMINNKVRTPIDVAVALYDEGYRNLVMVVGSDRVTEFEVTLNKYNGKEARHGFYNFKSIRVVSAGQRDPDAEGVEGASATKQRKAATDNDFITFSQGVPSSMNSKDAKRLFNDVRKGLGLREEKEFKHHVQLEPVSAIREAFVNNNLFQEGEEVVMTKNGIIGTIKYLGANYLIVESKGETWRCWLDQVVKVNPDHDISRDIAWVDAPYQPPGDAGLSSLNMLGEAKIAKFSQPEWGTPESTKKAKKITPGEQSEELDPIKATKERIKREKEQDKKRHDQMLDRARLALAKQKNRGMQK